MNRQDCLAAYHDFSRQASENARRLNFAGIAIIWIFKTQDTDGTVSFSPLLVWAGLFVVLSLSLDFLQYAYGTAAWGMFHRHKEIKGTPFSEDFQAPRWINWPTNSLFALKLVAVGVGYTTLFIYLSKILLMGNEGGD